MNFRIDMTRKTYDAVCSYLQRWGELYKLPGVTAVLTGTFRKDWHPNGLSATGIVLADVGLGGASALARRFDTALHGLGRSHVTKTLVKLDLRDLAEGEVDALILMARVANLKGMQRKALERIRDGIHAFADLDPLTRLAIMAVD